MKTATSMKNLGLGLCVVAAGFMVGGCNTTKATVDTTVNFFSSTSPNGLFSADGMVLKEQKIKKMTVDTFGEEYPEPEKGKER